jgi:hypothetical protein
VYCYGEYIDSSTRMNVHLRILITARFTTGEILRAYGMLGCVVDGDMYVVDDEIHDDNYYMCSEVCKHIHVNLRILITARFTTVGQGPALKQG